MPVAREGDGIQLMWNARGRLPAGPGLSCDLLFLFPLLSFSSSFLLRYGFHPLSISNFERDSLKKSAAANTTRERVRTRNVETSECSVCVRRKMRRNSVMLPPPVPLRFRIFWLSPPKQWSVLFLVRRQSPIVFFPRFCTF